jgi:small subunit ribosomal protein S21
MFSRNFKNENITHKIPGDDNLNLRPLEVVVQNGNFEEASRRFKTFVQNEGIIADYKTRQAYEKPSERKRRKSREAEERKFLLETREAQIISGEWDKKQKKKELKRQEKAAARRNQAPQQEE